MATINASATIASVVDGPDYKYTLTLDNASTSDAGIGTFWYAWVPGEDFLAASPISVTPPAGWTKNITNDGSGDGYAIQFIASSPTYDVQPGSSLTFSFVSGSPPAAVNGDSVFYPGTPVGTSYVYPGAPFSDDGHPFVVTQASGSGPPSGSTPTSTPLVSVADVSFQWNKKHMVTEITVDFSGPVNSGEADSVGAYRLTMAGNKGSFTAKNAKDLNLKSATYDTSLNAVTLTPRKSFALTKPVQLQVNGQAIEDSMGRLIDAAKDGQPGSRLVTILTRSEVKASPTTSSRPTSQSTPPIINRKPVSGTDPSPTPTPTTSPAPTPFPGYGN